MPVVWGSGLPRLRPVPLVARHQLVPPELRREHRVVPHQLLRVRARVVATPPTCGNFDLIRRSTDLPRRKLDRSLWRIHRRRRLVDHDVPAPKSHLLHCFHSAQGSKVLVDFSVEAFFDGQLVQDDLVATEPTHDRFCDHFSVRGVTSEFFAWQCSFEVIPLRNRKAEV